MLHLSRRKNAAVSVKVLIFEALFLLVSCLFSQVTEKSASYAGISFIGLQKALFGHAEFLEISHRLLHLIIKLHSLLGS